MIWQSSTYQCWTYLKQSKMNIVISHSAFLWCISQILCTLPPDHCSGDGMTISQPGLCSSTCKNLALKQKFLSALWNQILCKPNSANAILTADIRSWLTGFQPFYDWRLAVVIYNAQQIFIINHKNMYTNHLPWPGLEPHRVLSSLVAACYDTLDKWNIV